MVIGVSSHGGPGDLSKRLAQHIMTDGGSQLRANLAGKLSGATLTMDDANCVQTAGTQEYTCLAHYTVNDPTVGLSDQKYLLNLTGTCDSSGNCQWHSTGLGQPVGNGS